GVVAVVEKEPVVNFAVTAHAPRDRFIGIRPIMAVVAVQITEAVAEIPERYEIKNHVAPVEKEHREQSDCERGQLEISPEHVIIAAFAQFFSNRPDVVAEEAEEYVAPRTFRFAIVAVAIDRQPIDRVALFVLSIRIA